MAEHIDDLTAPQGGKSNKHKRKEYINPDTLPLKEGDILKLDSKFTVAETDWKDVEGTWYNQSDLTAAQLVIARKYKLVVPHNLAIVMANSAHEQCIEVIRRLRREYVSSLLSGFTIEVDDIETAARDFAGIREDIPKEKLVFEPYSKYDRYITFKHGVLWAVKHAK